VAGQWPYLGARGRDRAHAVKAIRKGGVVHGSSLLQFLIVSNELSSDPSEHAKLASHLTVASTSRGLDGADYRDSDHFCCAAFRVIHPQSLINFKDASI
jgi:hypothetical protein